MINKATSPTKIFIFEEVVLTIRMRIFNIITRGFIIGNNTLIAGFKKIISTGLIYRLAGGG